MRVHLLTHTTMPEHTAAHGAALCTASDDIFRSLDHAMNGEHLSVLEHASFTFIVEEVSRVLLQQLVRHRVASYSV